MVFAFLFFLELFLLFLLSRQVTSLLSHFFHRVTRSTKATIYLLAILFFPGTLLHELAHYVTAKLFFVQVTQMNLFPKLEGSNVKLGSITMNKPDILRSLLIGMAPFFSGTTILLTLFFFAGNYHLFSNHLITFFIGYAVFEIGNTMFSSKKDMEGAIELILILAVIVIILYFAGVRTPAMKPDIFFANPIVTEVFQKGIYFLIAPLGIDIVLIFLLRLTV